MTPAIEHKPDAFVAKLGPLSAWLSCTYLGGSVTDDASRSPWTLPATLT
jgi:hypothetical protein